MDRLEDYFWDFLQDHLPYSLYDALYQFASYVSITFYALYTFASYVPTIFYVLNGVFTYVYKAV
jgi:hypothetical protein